MSQIVLKKNRSSFCYSHIILLSQQVCRFCARYSQSQHPRAECSVNAEELQQGLALLLSVEIQTVKCSCKMTCRMKPGGLGTAFSQVSQNLSAHCEMPSVPCRTANISHQNPVHVFQGKNSVEVTLVKKERHFVSRTLNSTVINICYIEKNDTRLMQVDGI